MASAESKEDDAPFTFNAMNQRAEIEDAHSRANGHDRRSKLISLIVGVPVMLAAGSPLMFGSIQPMVKQRFALSETEAALVNTSVVVGLYLGIIQGMLFDWLGVRRLCLIATTLLSFGFFMSWLLSSSHPPAPLVAFFFFLIGQGSHGFYTSRS